jgi:hypothetical protein
MRAALARGQCFDDADASPNCSQPSSPTPAWMQGAWWDHLGQLDCAIRWRAVSASRRSFAPCLSTAHEPRHEPASARVLPSGEPCCTRVRNLPLAEVTIAVPSTRRPQHARIAKSISCCHRAMLARPDSSSVAITCRAGPLLHRSFSCWSTFAKPCPGENGRCWCTTTASDVSSLVSLPGRVSTLTVRLVRFRQSVSAGRCNGMTGGHVLRNFPSAHTSCATIAASSL